MLVLGTNCLEGKEIRRDWKKDLLSYSGSFPFLKLVHHLQLSKWWILGHLFLCFCLNVSSVSRFQHWALASSRCSVLILEIEKKTKIAHLQEDQELRERSESMGVIVPCSSRVCRSQSVGHLSFWRQDELKNVKCSECLLEATILK